MLDNFTYIELTLAAIALLLLILSGVLWYRVSGLRKFQKKFFAGTAARDLEQVIMMHGEEIKNHSSDIDRLARVLENMGELQKLNIQKLGLVRFSPFTGEGGNNSFALALLDANNNGVVMSSLYGRDSHRIYAKPVRGGESEMALTDEETQAILQSQGLETFTKTKLVKQAVNKKLKRN